jgi:two-component system OmpR family response regulator
VTVNRILVVNDEPALTRLVDEAFAAEGWTVLNACDARTAVDVACRFHPDLAVVDTALPDIDGLQAMRRLRSHEPDLPILFISSAAAIEDRVRALKAGGDDYVVKPFSLSELTSRVRALLRRTRNCRPTTLLTVADLILDERSHEVNLAGRPLALTATEFNLLRYMMINTGRVLPREVIVERVWQFERDGKSRILENYIFRLRRMIDTGRPPMIHTVRGIGYILEPRHR